VGVAATAWFTLVMMYQFFPGSFVPGEAQVDAAMLAERTGGPLPTPAELFPVLPGVRRWVAEGEEAEGEEDAPVVFLETRAEGHRMVGGETGVALTSRRNGVPFQTEVYRIDARGVFGLATGPNAEVLLSPPLPLLLPGANGASVRAWRGELVQGTNRTPARALIRLDGPERVVTPAGTFPGAYRVDLHVQVGPHDPTTPPVVSTLWLAPGAGVVRQRAPLGPGGRPVTFALAPPPRGRVE